MRKLLLVGLMSVVYVISFAQCDLQFANANISVCQDTGTVALEVTTVTANTITWYDSVYNVLGTGTIYNASITTAGTYTYYAQEEGCSTYNSCQLVVKRTPDAPTGTGIKTSVLWSYASIFSLPSMDLIYISGASVTIKDSIGTIIGNEINEPLALFPNHINSLGHYEFDVQQIKMGCTSPVVKSVWDIILCPTPAPEPADIEICEGDNLPIINANGIADGTNFIWKDTNGTQIATTMNLDLNSFGSSYSTPGKYIFKVSQMSYDPAGQLCRGPEADVIFTVNQTPEFKISLSDSILCFYGKELEMRPVAIDTSYTFSTANYSLNNSYIPDSEIKTIGVTGYLKTDSATIGNLPDNSNEFTITATVTNSKGCIATNTGNFSIFKGAAFMRPPFTDSQYYSKNTNETSPTIEFKKVLDQNQVICWDANDEKISDENSYLPSFSEIGKYNINLSFNDTLHGCKSLTDSIIYEILPCFSTPQRLSDSVTTLFLHESTTLEVAETDVVWYNYDKQIVGSGATFTPTFFHPGTYIFHARREDGSCISKFITFAVNISTYKISGKVYYDINNNSVLNTEDIVLQNQTIKIIETGEIISTNEQGEYCFETDNVGTFHLEYLNTNQNITILGSSSKTITLSTTSPIKENNNFRVSINNYHELDVDLTSVTSPVVGRNVSYRILLQNHNVMQRNVGITILYDTSLVTAGINTSPYLKSSELRFFVDSIEPFRTIAIYFYLVVNPDFTLNNKNLVTKLEMNYSNSLYADEIIIDSVSQTIRNSYDPNDKAVSPSFLEPGYVLMDQELEYTIRFQNKGTAEAYNIYITDTLDSNLDFSTFSVKSWSHDMHYQLSGNIVTFYFDNIMLPYETQDEPGSHGFVKYTIKPNAGLTDSTIVENFANIFFDYNPAVVTNTTQSIYVNQLPKSGSTDTKIEGIDSDDNYIKLSPNPVQYGYVSLSTNVKSEKTMTISDIKGKTILQQAFTSPTIKIDCTKLKSGIYTVTVIGNGQIFIEKLIVE